MNFKKSIIELSERIKVQRDAVKTEEATKTSFIMPLIAALGYDIFDPFEVIPEMDCDLTRRGDKIDYAIQKDGKTIILIECKHCTSNLNLHDTQLAKYYAASNARFGVLTNGVIYRFYTDIHKTNIMDEHPFLVVDITTINENQIEQLRMFHKSQFETNEVYETAKVIKYSTDMINTIRQEMENPSEELISLLTKKAGCNFSQNQPSDFFRTIIKSSFYNLINEMATAKVDKAVCNLVNQKTDEMRLNIQNEGVEASLEEIEACGIVRNILTEYIDATKLTFINHKSYLVVSIDSKWYWICRLILKSSRKSIVFPSENYNGSEHIYANVKGPNDIYKFKNKLIESLRMSMDFYNKYNKESITD